MSRPAVSVIMSVFNGERCIAHAVASILAQSFRDFELIVVDDGSTDQTLSVLNQFKDPRLHIVSRENRGLTRSLNEAISLSRSDWIARQDADDISLYHRLERQLAHLSENSKLRMLGTSAFMSNRRGLINEIFVYPQSTEDIRHAARRLNPFVHGSVVIARSLISEVGGYDESYRYVQDYELWSRILGRCRFENLQDPLYARFRTKDCSEVTVDKTSVSEQIQKRIVQQYGPDNECSEAAGFPVAAISAYPILSQPRPYMAWLADTFIRMARVLRRDSLPASKAVGSALLYCPWSCFKQHQHPRKLGLEG